MKFEELIAQPVSLPDMEPGEADALRNSLHNFVQSDEWEWLKRQIEDGLRAAHLTMVHTKNVGAGAAEVTAAQGAFMALERIYKIPTETLDLLNKRS